MDIRTFLLGPLSTNGYLVSEGGEAVFVDPGGDPAPVVEALSREGLTLTHILVTHLHCDHIYGCAALAKATGAPILAYEKDDFLMDSEIGRGGGGFGLPPVRPFAHENLAPGTTRFLGLPVNVLHTPGHTPGSLSFHFPEQGVVFGGDLLFKRSIGRSDFPGGDGNQLLESVRRELFTLPDETVVYSGHGPWTTVGDERMHNPFFQVRGRMW